MDVIIKWLLSPAGAIITSIIISLLSVILGFHLGYSAKKPRFEFRGCSSGSGPTNIDIIITTVGIYNNPNFFFWKVNRDAAKIVSATIYDAELKKGMGVRVGRMEDNGKIGPNQLIHPAETGQLTIFLKKRYNKEFYVFQDDNLDKLPQGYNRKYEDYQKKFTLQLTDQLGRKYSINFTAMNGDQGVHINFTYSFQKRLREAAQVMRIIK